MESEIILQNSSFLTQHLHPTQGCEWKIIVEMFESSFKYKLQKHFLRRQVWGEQHLKRSSAMVFEDHHSNIPLYCLNQNSFKFAERQDK